MSNLAQNLDNLFNFDIAVQAMNELSAILVAEVSDIKTNNIKNITENAPKKMDLIQYVENMKEILKQNPDISKNLTDEQKNLFRKVAQDLHDSVTLNNSELMKAKYFNDELIKLIVASVQNVSSPARTYTRDGRRAKQSKLKTPASITFNKEI